MGRCVRFGRQGCGGIAGSSLGALPPQALGQLALASPANEGGRRPWGGSRAGCVIWGTLEFGGPFPLSNVCFNNPQTLSYQAMFLNVTGSI